MNHKKQLIPLCISLLLLGTAIVCHFIFAIPSTIQEKTEDVPLLPTDFDSSRIGSIIVKNALGTTTLLRTESGWRHKEKQGCFANQQDIETLIFALCSENAVTTTLSSDLIQEAGFPPAPTGAELTVCDTDGNTIVNYILGKQLESHNGAPLKRYLVLPDKRTATSQYLFPLIERPSQAWIEHEIPVGIPQSITLIRNNVPEWQIVNKHKHFNLQASLPDDMTCNQTAVDQVVSTLVKLTIIDVLPPDTQKKVPQQPSVMLFIMRQDGIVLFYTFSWTAQGVTTLRLSAEAPKQNLSSTGMNDEEAAIRRQALEKAASQFNEHYGQWLFLVNLPQPAALLPPLSQLSQKL